MKTLKIFLFALAIVLFSSFNVQSQSVTEKLIDFPWVIWDDYSPDLGVLTGTCTVHLVIRYDKYGNEIALKVNSHLTNLTSSTTGEIFLANVIQQYHHITPGSDVIISRMKIVLKGDMGTRMVCDETIEFNFATEEYVSLEHNHKEWQDHVKLW